MTDAVLNRLRQGVRVEVLVPGTIDHKFVRQASRATWGPLLKAGVKIHDCQPALLHAKTVVIYGRWATIGSANLDPRSYALSQELNIVVYDRAIARRLEEVFQADIAHARPVHLERWQHRGMQARLFELFMLPLRDVL